MNEEPCRVALGGYEQPTFCFLCGAAAIAPDDAAGPTGWSCAACGYHGDRWCVRCPDPGCGNAFCHLHSPLRADRARDGAGVAGATIVYAEGVAWCDACHHHALYQWRNPPWSEPELTIVGWSGTAGGRFAVAMGSAFALTQTTS